MEQSHQQVHLLKSPQDIYSSSQHSPTLSYFFNSNRILSSHTPTHVFFQHFQQHSPAVQTAILNQILTALRTVSTNAYLLNQQIRGKYQFNLDRYEESHHERHLISRIVDLLMKNVGNYHIFNLLLQVLEQLLPYSPLEDMLLYEAISKLTVNFHKSEVHACQNFAAATIVKAYYHAKIMMQKDPANMLVFHGQNKIQIIPNRHRPLTWILKDGYTLFFWINLENVKSTNDVSLPKLFTFYAPESGGVEAYIIDNKVYYRIIGAKYTEPQIGSNGIFLGELQNKKWTFMAIEHEGHHTFQKSKLKCYINKNKPAVFNLDPPKISSSAKTKYIFFDKIYCKASSMCLFPSLIGQEGIDEYNKNINSIQCVKNNKAYVFENRQGKVYERSGLGSSHNYIFQRSDQMNFDIIVPLYFMTRFQEKDQEYPVLNQLLNILILFLRQSASNQLEACRGRYFNILSQLIVDGPENPFDQNTIKSIVHIKHTITDANLLDQYFSDFLWPLLYAKIPITRKEEILEIIKNAFTQNIAHYSTQIGLDEMINVLQILGGGTLTCCEKHFKIATNKFQRQLLEGEDTVFGQQKKALSYVFALIESTLQNSKLHFPHEIYKLCRLLCLKCSPCFTLQLMSLIRRLLTQKFTERMSENQTRQIIKYFQEKKVHYLFIHLIENQFFAEIKAQSVKLIYSLLIKKSSIEESEISNIISKALWKINEFAEDKNSPLSKKGSGSSLDEESPTHKEEKEAKPLVPAIEEEQDKPFELVGPQAPALSNRLKGNKSFDFGFVAEKKSARSRQIMEEEKTTQPLDFLNQDKPYSAPATSEILVNRKPTKGKFGLTINTEAINEMYTFGGEKGQQLVISEDEELHEVEKIVKLAKICANKMKGSLEQEKEEPKEQKQPNYAAPPMTTTNKKAVSKKPPPNLRLISEEEEQTPSVKIPTPLATKKSNKTPTSIKSSNQQNLYTLYNSLLESCLGVSFQTCLISNSKVQVPSILSIFFKWIPQTDLETKFLNDLDIILESSQNMAMIIELPELYDFLFELCYKCLLFEQMKEKRIYVQKLENIIKVIFAFIYRQDVGGLSKFSYLLNWVDEKKNQNYQPKCLFLTSRYVPLLILECIEELLIMNNSNNPIMQRNFQSLATVLDAIKKVVPQDDDQINVDNFERVILTTDFELPTSLVPYFKSDWADFILYQKYLFIFKRFYCTDLYNRGFKNFSNMKNDFLTLLMQSNPTLLQREASYYLRNNFLVSLIEIQRAMLIELQHTQPKEAEQFGNEAVWQTILLVTMVQTNKEKTIKSQRSEIILAFLKSCKLLAEKGIDRIVEIVSMLSEIKHYLSISNKQAQNSGKAPCTTVILDDIISNYIPEYLLNMGKTDLESFILNFSQVWIPNQNQYKKVHSDLFVSSRQKVKKEKQFNFIQFITNIVEEENERKEYCDVILDAHNRTLRNYCRKAWTELRIYNPVWIHPELKWQHNHLFTKSYYSYEKYQKNPIFKYKISKQMSKNKARYLLKPKLKEPEMVSSYKKEQEEHHHYEFNLQKALMVMNQKLIIGAPKKSWIVSKGQDSLYFIMGFKKVRIINTLTVRSGFLAIISDNLVFICSSNKEKVSHLAMDQYKMTTEQSLHKVWALEYIKEVHRRRYVNKKKSVFIFFIHGKGLAIDFDTQDDAEDFCKKVAKLKNKCINLSFVSKSADPRKYFQSLDYMKKWMGYEMSNLDYLMELNIFSGRNFNDLTQYPVFPWTLINFGQKKPDYQDQKQIRNLNCPMGACGSEERIRNFQDRYEAMHMDDEYATNFHYGTHYSSPGIIYHFLVRLSPYTEGSILLQSGKFDFADRLFFSLVDSYRNATAEYSDVRELVPEMYTIPEVYLNLNGLDFGVMQNKKRVHNLELPEWARDNPYFFVYHLRKTLEEDYVSRTINNWIDLIFGYKQRGEQAAKALNCFYYLTYEDALPWDKLSKEHDIQSLESQIVNFGQTPSQLFLKPHPQRNIIFNLKNYKMICDLQAEPRVYRPTKNTKQVNQDQIQLNILKQPDESIIFMKWVSESKVVFIRKSGDVIFYKCSPNTNAASKVPFQCTVEKEKKLQRIKKPVFDPTQYYDLSLDVQNFPMELIGGGHTLCLGGLCDGKLILIDIDTGHTTNTYHSHFYTICCIKADSSRENFLVTGDIRGNVIMWQIKTSHNISKLVQKKSFRDQYDQITSIFFSYELLAFAVASKDGSVILHNTITGSKQRAYYHPKRLPISDVVISTNPMAAILLFCNADNTIYTFSINGMLISRLHEKMFSYFLSPIIVRDSRLFQYVIFGNERSEVHVRTLPFLESPAKNMYKVARDVCVNKICISKNNRFLVTGCSDGELTIITDPSTLTHP